MRDYDKWMVMVMLLLLLLLMTIKMKIIMMMNTYRCDISSLLISSIPTSTTIFYAQYLSE